jgi:hypothetical protein
MSKRFRIALSFAGEKRDFVAKVASLLANRFGKDHILYDKYHEAEFARSDLAFHLPALYHEEVDLVVAVLCGDYEKKEWCGLEWDAIYGLIKKRKVGEVLLSRFDRVDGKGLYGLAGFIELDNRTPQEAAALILERLALNEDQPKDYYTAPRSDAGEADWPEIAPALDWHVADHVEAQFAFAHLITRTAPFRLLSIHGSSETGKSHLTKQFLRNALKIPQLVCGRFDFKGSSDMDGALRTFAEHLNVPTPIPSTGASGQLAHILGVLKGHARPTLLIFDTFELAGEADRWIRENLLLSIVRSPWLRVIIVGQYVPTSRGEPWAGIGTHSIELRPPTPQEWFNYGQPHKPGITLEFVSQAHAYCRGKSALLAQLLGPA